MSTGTDTYGTDELDGESLEEMYERDPERVGELAERDDAIGAAARAVRDLVGGREDERASEEQTDGA
jgi:hypothetical protein